MKKNEEHQININDERDVRLRKLRQLQEQDIAPYPSKTYKTHTNKDVLSHFPEHEKNKDTLIVAGRVMLIREHGKIAFAQLRDDTDDLQIVFTKEALDTVFDFFLKYIDIGDFIEITGYAYTTQKGQPSVYAQQCRLLSKALLPLPEKWHGLADIETRLRKRYVDLIVNKNTKDLFKKRAKFISSMRSFLEKEGFLEVETPVLEHIPGGAEANPFITHHDTLDINLYLRISLELHLKRLMVGGFEKIYEIGRVFRNEGMSTQHLQEFTMMECYWAFADYADLMDFTQRMYQYLIQETFQTLNIEYQGVTLDFSKDFARVDYVEIMKEKTGIDLDQFDDANALKKAITSHDIHISFEKNAGLGRVIDQLYKKMVRPHLIQPTFLINHPVAISPLAKKIQKNPKRVERIQILVAGAELGNGFSELNDPLDQKARFEEQQALRDAGDVEAQMIDEDYITALEHGMPPTAGFGVGIDRLFAVLSNASSIREVVFFPTMKPEE